jgi:PTH1 family peptidyl-tRNA hydrolase
MNLLFVGLGNPGKEYEKTRHNVGFMLVDAIKNKFGMGNYVEKFTAYHSKIHIDGKDIILLKPQTYMNLSARSVLPAMMFYKLKPEHIWVVHDDLDLEIARVKVKFGGGNGGHNGLKSIDGAIGPNYNRLRIGISRPNHGEVSDYVLKNFADLEKEKIEKVIEKIVDNLELLLNEQPDKLLNKIALPEGE